MTSLEQLFRDEWTASADVYLPILSAPGSLHRNPQLAATYERSTVSPAETRRSMSVEMRTAAIAPEAPTSGVSERGSKFSEPMNSTWPSTAAALA